MATLTLPLSPGDFKWPCNGMLTDLRAAIRGKANYLVALGLLIYTEVLGRMILQQQGKRKLGREEAFYCFYDKYMGQGPGQTQKVYELFRHGIAHTYAFLAADQSIVKMRADPDWVPEDKVKGVTVALGGKIKEFSVNAYYRDFQRGLGKAAVEFSQNFLP